MAQGLLEDYETWLEKLAPREPVSQYRHNTGEDNTDAHIKRSIVGREVVVAITNGTIRQEESEVDIWFLAVVFYDRLLVTANKKAPPIWRRFFSSCRLYASRVELYHPCPFFSGNPRIFLISSPSMVSFSSRTAASVLSLSWFAASVSFTLR